MLSLHRKLRVAGFVALVLLTGAMFTSASFAQSCTDPQSCTAPEDDLSLNFTKIEWP